MTTSRSEFERLLLRLEAPVRRAFERVIEQAQKRVNYAAAVRAVRAGDIDALMQAAGIREGMWGVVTEQIRTAFMEAGIFTLNKDLPKRLFLDFNINNPRAESWLRMKSSQLITGNLMPEQRGAIQEILRAGMARGDNPQTTALDIVGRATGRGQTREGGVLGLTRKQAQYVSNAYDDLIDLNPRYFERRLRDKRFDSIIRESFRNGKPLPKGTRDKIISRYEAKMLKHRGDNIARTETLGAMNEAADEALRQIIDEGLAPSSAAKRIWRHGRRSKQERPGHVLMSEERQTRMVNEPFVNPLTGAVLAHPGAGPASEVINCTCYLEHDIDFVAVEVAA